MMGQLKHEQEQLFYEFRLDEVVPAPCARDRGRSILPGYVLSLHPTTRRLVARRLTRY